ncbi:MAG: tripartite tricarboxylate transporter substrate-binding protein, partial [Beijerinckiaceae bacterium]|nr:tripartite tricarboxylate transporter substrate-binding protein [Beijerinckiaceae bacterium]
MKRTMSVAAIAAVLAGWPLPHAHAQSVEAFYKGKDVRILIGSGMGGTYGLYAQLAARRMKKHIPGHPNIIVQSMPGAGGNVALNYSYNIAPKDGSLMHMVHAEAIFETLLNPKIKFKAQNYGYIGRFTDADAVGVATKKSGVRTLDDAKKKSVSMGVAGKANIYALGPLVLNQLIGTKFKIIAGYRGGSGISLAMQRGELDGGGFTVASVQVIQAEALKNGDIVPFFAISTQRVKAFPGIPAITEFGGAKEKTLLEIYSSAGTIGRSLAFPPGVSADKLTALRKAFQDTLADPEFVADTKRSNIPLSTMTGEQVADYVSTLINTPADKLADARKLHQG